jgi:5-methylcytosine-specific restriction endonuclease McrA
MKVRCGNCRGYFDREQAIQVQLGYFCTEVCRQEKATSLRAAKITKAGVSTPASQGPAKVAGKRKRTTRKTREPFPEGLKEEVHTADDWHCRFCNTRSRPLRAHHIIYRSEGGRHLLENLVSLCDECHGVVHSNKKKYQPLAKLVVTLRDHDTVISIPDLERLNG